MVLKSQRYGPSGSEGALPYRIDQLTDSGFGLEWTDRNLDGWWRRVAEATEARATPWVQTLLTFRQRRRAAAVVAIFESEGHGLALARSVLRVRRPPLIIMGCWLADLVRHGDRRRRLYRWLYRSVDAVVVFSGNQRRTLEDGLGLDPSKVHVVRFGIDLDELACVTPSESGAVVAAGRDRGRDWTTLFAAVRGTGWSVPLMTRPSQIAGLDVPSEIEFLSTVDRAGYLEILAAASVVVLPTHVREYPTGQTVLLEAMALGKACVVTDTPAMREYVDDGVTGVLVALDDPDALRITVTDLLGDDIRRRSIGENARHRSLAEGGSAAMWSAVAEVVNEVRGSDRTRPGT